MKFLNNLSIGKRLAFGFAVTLALSIVIAAIGVWRLQQVAGATRHMMETPLAKERMISDWYSKIDSAIRRTTAIARSSDATLGAFFSEESKASTAASAELQKNIEPLISDADEKAMWDRVMEQRKAYIASRDKVAKLKTDGELEQANETFEKTYRPAAAQYQALVQDLLSMQRGKIDPRADEERCRSWKRFRQPAIPLRALLRSAIQPQRSSDGGHGRGCLSRPRVPRHGYRRSLR